jgi:hypothetical protein
MDCTENIAKLEIYLDNVTDACSEEGSYQVDNVNTLGFGLLLCSNLSWEQFPIQLQLQTIVLLISPLKAHSHDMTGSYSCQNGVDIPVDFI